MVSKDGIVQEVDHLIDVLTAEDYDASRLADALEGRVDEAIKAWRARDPEFEDKLAEAAAPLKLLAEHLGEMQNTIDMLLAFTEQLGKEN